MVDGMTTIAEDECMGCGICIDTCPEGALRLEREPSKGVPLEITKLMDVAVSTYS
jgi:ferredoxin